MGGWVGSWVSCHFRLHAWLDIVTQFIDAYLFRVYTILSLIHQILFLSSSFFLKKVPGPAAQRVRFPRVLLLAPP